MSVIVTERSGDRKLTANGNVSATYVAQQTCHDDCPLKKNGCYAEQFRIGLHTHRLNKKARALKLGLKKLRLKLARQEAKGIATLSGTRKLRVHVVGDCATAEVANCIGNAMVKYERKGKAAWTYTHSWRRFGVSAWRGARVLASCEKAEDVPAARAKGYAVALIVPPHPTNKVYSYKGLNVIPCPAQFKYGPEKERKVTCEDCTICQSHDMLREKNLVVGFQPDLNNQTAKMLKIINA